VPSPHEELYKVDAGIGEGNV